MAKNIEKQTFINTDWWLVRCLLCVAAGLLLWFYPAMLAKGVVIGLGIVLIITGIASIVMYKTSDSSKNMFYLNTADAILLFAIGFALILKSDFFVNWVIFVVGLLVVVLSVIQIIEIFSMRKFSEKPSVFVFLNPIILFILGLIVIIKPTKIVSIIGYFAAVALIYYGVVGLVLSFKTRKLIKIYKENNQTENKTIDVQYADNETITDSITTNEQS